MKEFLLLMLFITTLSLTAQTSKLVEPTQAGTLRNYFTEQEKATLTTLTLKGKVDARDFAFMRDELKALSTLTMQLASIQSYSGTSGTHSGQLLTYPANEIPAYAFYNPVLLTYKPGLTSVTLPLSGTSIGTQAFYFCWNLTAINLPNNLKRIGDYAFYGCYALNSFSALSTHTRFSTDNNGILYNKNKDTLFLCPNARAGNISLPASVKHIDNSAFENCYNLTSVTLPTSLVSTGSYAFAYCSGITGNLTLPASLTTLGDGSFYGCYNLTGTVSFPASLTKLGSFCFFESYSIQAYNIDSSNPRFSSVDGMLYNKTADTLFSCPAGKPGQVNLPQSLKLIGSHAFYGCSKLTGTLTIPASTDYIGYYAFNGCTSLTGYSVTTGNNWFGADKGVLYSKNFDRLVACPAGYSGTFLLPENILSIDPGAFSNCTQLTGTLSLPSTLSWIGEYAFYNCPGLSGFEASNANPWFSTSEGLLFNKNSDTLYICPFSKQGEYTLPAGVKHIGAGAFSGCTNLSAVSSAQGLQSLGYAAFSGCINLQTVNLPASITSIENNAFYGCTGLNRLSIAQPQPPVVGYYTFELANQGAAQLVVPTGSLQLYRNAPYWQNFVLITEQYFSTSTPETTSSQLVISSTFSGLNIKGLIPGLPLVIYTAAGREVVSTNATTTELTLPFQAKGVFIISNGKNNLKFIR